MLFLQLLLIIWYEKVEFLARCRSSGIWVLTMTFDYMIVLISNTFAFYFFLVFWFFSFFTLLLFKFNACLICFPLISHVHIVAPVRFNCFFSYITFKLNIYKFVFVLHFSYFFTILLRLSFSFCFKKLL